MTENTIGFIYNEHEKNADKFKVFDQFVDELSYINQTNLMMKLDQLSSH